MTMFDHDGRRGGQNFRKSDHVVHGCSQNHEMVAKNVSLEPPWEYDLSQPLFSLFSLPNDNASHLLPFRGLRLRFGEISAKYSALK